MRTLAGLGLVAALVLPSPVQAGEKVCQPHVVRHMHIGGTVLDFTQNHGKDRRIYSMSLGCMRDIYVYLPPDYDPNAHYPMMIYLHGVLQDERSFLSDVVPHLDRAIRKGDLPPMIVAAPDGSFDGNPGRLDAGSFFINTCRGDFQEWIRKDVWNFVMTNFKIRPEAKAHILAGSSMGGFGAYNLAIKHPEQFGIVIGVMPALNLRWSNGKGDSWANFDPYDWGWRNRADDPMEVVGMFGLGKVRIKDFLYPIFGEGCCGVINASWENPIEMVDRYNLKNGELDMFVGFGEMDNFNLDAGAQSFIYLCRSRGIAITGHMVEQGQHSEETAVKMFPAITKWLRKTMECRNVAGAIHPDCTPRLEPVKK